NTWPFLVMLAAYIIASGVGNKPRLHESLLAAGWAVMSLYSARNIPLFAIIAAPYIGTGIQGIVEQVPILERFDQTFSKVESKSIGILWPLLTVVALTVSYYFQPYPSNQFDPNKFPVQAVNWLEKNPQQGNTFNNFIWGGYLLYRLWPIQTVFIDGQTDFYGEALTQEYTQVMSLGEGWETILAKYDVSWVIVQSDKPLVKALQDQAGWVIIYQDSTATILHKP
ncbi:MAG TPA: hypothetical protein VHP14_16170, partial [Anaerolineales bacterium]|nr:hypothetical protein [Anaerolineales bacterium]